MYKTKAVVQKGIASVQKMGQPNKLRILLAKRDQFIPYLKAADIGSFSIYHLSLTFLGQDKK